jgi:hypothetical protein
MTTWSVTAPATLAAGAVTAGSAREAQAARMHANIPGAPAIGAYLMDCLGFGKCDTIGAIGAFGQAIRIRTVAYQSEAIP